MVAKTPRLGEVISEDALKFSQEHHILECVEKALKAAREVFTNAQSISAGLKQDPEYGDVYVDVHVVLHDDEQPETAAEKDSDCLMKWAPLVPPDLGGLIQHSSSWKS